MSLSSSPYLPTQHSRQPKQARQRWSNRRALAFLKSRLSLRIALSVFSCIVAIEAVILVPSVYRREQELLEQRAALAKAGLQSLSNAQGENSAQLLAHVRAVGALPTVLGGSLYDHQGRWLGSFGDAPQRLVGELRLGDRASSEPLAHLNRRERQYETAWPIAATNDSNRDYWVVFNHDTTGIPQQLLFYTRRILGLVVIISGSVTLGTLLVLRPLLIRPILDLRQDLLEAAPAALQTVGSGAAQFRSLRHRRQDELGEVIHAFEQMFQQVSDAIAQRQQAQAAQARLAEIGELAAMIVHEIRNPLSTVYIALTAFQRLDLPRAGQLRLELALEEAERLKRLLNEILAYSKTPKLAEQAFEINQFCSELAESLRETPAAQGRQIQLEMLPASVSVEGDRDKLKQVFINLVTNACEAIEPGECVTWRLTLIASEPCLAETPVDRTLVIQVHNGGEPIPTDILPKLMQPFVSTKATGNGLGLSITKRIVEAHGGQLTLESSTEQGTLATVTLPLR